MVYVDMGEITLEALCRKKGLTQEALAEELKVSRAAVGKWCRGEARPHPDTALALAKRLGVEDPDDLFQGERTKLKAAHEASFPKLTPDEENSPIETIPNLTPSHSLQSLLSMNLTSRLLSIAHTDYPTPDTMQVAVRTAIQETDTMNMGNPNYEITRREALCTLASLPAITLGQKPTFKTAQHEELLRHCTAALEACWELYRGSDASVTQYAFDCVSTYVPMLEAIAKDSHQYRKEALELATQYALLQTLLGWACVGAKESVIYALKARDLSKETGNILLQLSAFPKLGWTYTQSNNYTEALKTMQEGAYVLKCYQSRKNNAPLPFGVIGNFNSSYAMVQADNGLSPDTALGIAVDSEPTKGHIALVEFQTTDKWWEAAKVCSARGDSKQAIKYLGKLMDVETLTYRYCGNLQLSPRGLIGAINTLTHALLQSPKREMDYVIKTWKAAIEGAKILKSEQRYRDALSNFEIMKVLYPGEQAIMKLAPLTEHWSKQ